MRLSIRRTVVSVLLGYSVVAIGESYYARYLKSTTIEKLREEVKSFDLMTLNRFFNGPQKCSEITFVNAIYPYRTCWIVYDESTSSSDATALYLFRGIAPQLSPNQLIFDDRNESSTFYELMTSGAVISKFKKSKIGNNQEWRAHHN